MLVQSVKPGRVALVLEDLGIFMRILLFHGGEPRRIKGWKEPAVVYSIAAVS